LYVFEGQFRKNKVLLRELPLHSVRRCKGRLAFSFCATPVKNLVLFFNLEKKEKRSRAGHGEGMGPYKIT
jgi:hypothetical protein